MMEISIRGEDSAWAGERQGRVGGLCPAADGQKIFKNTGFRMAALSEDQRAP
jgi:hypothetical protein